MKKNNIKKGVSLVSIVIIIVVMIILSTIIVSYSLDSVNSGNISMFGAEITNIQTEVDNYYLRNSTYPIGESIEYTVPNNTSDFDGESLVNGKITLNKINYSLIGIKNLQFGNENKTNDKYAISTTTGKVYYLLGISYKSHTYYTITDEFVNILGVNYKKQVGYKDVVEYDVIFSVSNTNPTNIPVTVTVKIPKAATVNSVTATNSKEVGSETSNDIYKLYMINSTGENRNGNYDITVNYTLNGVTKTANYSVTNFNITSPVITYTSEVSNGLRTVNLNIVGDNIKKVKYETAYITDNTYFQNYGKVVNNNSFVVPSDELFTIYVEDKQKNSSLATNFVSIIPGSYIEYDVAYTDMEQPANNYSSLNGWRIESATLNSDGSYSNVKLMSTGVPASIYCKYNDTSTNKSWWVTDNDKLEEFKSVLSSLGDRSYVLYEGDNQDFHSLQVAAGLYYNFGDIKFMYSTSSRGKNLAYFTSIITKSVTYNSVTNASVEKSGTELFNIYKDYADVRLLTLPEANIALGRENIDSKSRITAENYIDGLFWLQNLTSVPNMDNFNTYTANKYSLLASPWPGTNEYYYVMLLMSDGGFSRGNDNIFNIRPVIAIKSGVKVKFIDTNNNNVPEIVIAN